MFHETHGAGRPIVFLHGFGATSYSWNELVPSLSAKHQLLLLDLKGFGRSPKPRDGRYALRDQSELVVQFIVDHGLRNITLVGHSLGGGVALVTAITLMQRQPGVLSSLVLIDATAYDQPVPLYGKVFLAPILGPLLQHVLPVRFQVRFGLKKAYFDDGKILEERVNRYTESLRSEGGRYAIRETAKDIVPEDLDSLTAKYSTIKVPTLIVWGRHDEVVPLAMGERLHRAIPQSELVIVENAGHVPAEETPATVLQVISEFLELNRTGFPRDQIT